MGVATINLWVPDAFKNNCAIDNTYSFVATVQHCDGSVLEWKGGRFQRKDGSWQAIVGDPNGLKPGAPGFYDGVPGTGDPGTSSSKCRPGATSFPRQCMCGSSGGAGRYRKSSCSATSPLTRPSYRHAVESTFA